MTELNPYAPGTAVLTDSRERVPIKRTWYRNGMDLMVRAETSLPRVCIYTGQAVGASGWNGTRKLYWRNQAVLLLAILVPFSAAVIGAWSLLLFLLFLLGLVLSRKKIVISYWIPESRRRRIKRQRWMGSALFLLGLAMMISFIVAIPHADGLSILFQALFALLMMFGGLACFLQINQWSVKSHQDGWFAIRSCPRAFLDALEHVADTEDAVTNVAKPGT